MGWIVAAGFVVMFWALVWTSIPKGTKRELVAVPSLYRAARWYRATWIRAGLWWFAWPHLVDKLLIRGTQQSSTPGEAVWRDGKVSLTRYRDTRTHGLPVLLVHSLVSKPWILDLTPSRSLVAFLVEEGFDVFLLDWGDFDRTDAGLGLDEFAVLLRAAEAEVLALAGATRLNEIAYCLAATLAIRDAATQDKAHLASLVLIAPMVDFGVPGGFRLMLTHRLLRPVLALDADGMVPAAIVREAFHALRPQAVRTVWARLRNRRRIDGEYKDFYAGMAQWAWSQRDMPGALFFDVVELFRENPLVKGLPDASPLQSISTPMLVAVAGRDHIVPSGASQALGAVPGVSVEVVYVASGHVSMVVGTAAREVVWPALGRWLRDHR